VLIPGWSWLNQDGRQPYGNTGMLHGMNEGNNRVTRKCGRLYQSAVLIWKKEYLQKPLVKSITN